MPLIYLAESRGQHIGWAEPTVFDGVELGNTHLDYADVTSRYLGQNQELLRITLLSMLAQVVGSCCVKTQYIVNGTVLYHVIVQHIEIFFPSVLSG